MTEIAELPRQRYGDGLAEQIAEKTRGRVRSYLASKDDWNLARSLKNLIEQAVHDYEHRALVELLQNAHDAHDPKDRKGRVAVLLDPDAGSHGVLYVANTGRGFTASNFDAITDVARSDKRPEEGIGNKGIGFKSVLQLSRRPEIYSSAEGSALDGFGGYRFSFAEHADLLAMFGASTAESVTEDVFHLCLPVPLADTPPDVARFAAEGYVTVVRLPLKSDEALSEARQQITGLVGQPPALLFLRRLVELEVAIAGEPDEGATLRRGEGPAFRSGTTCVAEVDLGAGGTYLVGEREVDGDALAAAVQRSIAGEHISSGWAHWKGPAFVAVAWRSDAELDSGRLYTHLPMGDDARSPLPAHVNAPFFAKLARVNLEGSVPLNDLLLDEAAALCADMLLGASTGALPLPPEAAVDLLSWTGPHQNRLVGAFEALGSPLAGAAVVPLDGPTGCWGTLAESHAWSSEGSTVLTAGTLRERAGARLTLAGLSAARTKRLDAAAQSFAGRRLRPDERTVACWAEKVAHDLASRPFDAATWGRFYDDLARAVKEDRSVLAGRRILIDDEHKLRMANGRAADGRSAAAFFSPQADGDGDQVQDLRPPKRLRRRVFFMAQEIAWNTRSGAVISKRPGRKMLEDDLVSEYRASDLLPVIGKALEAKPTADLAADVLMWAFRYAQSRDEPPWPDLRKMGLLVPTRGGAWLPATAAVFGKSWDRDTGGWLEELLERASTCAPELARGSAQLLAEPTASPFRGSSAGRLRAFLGQLGVRSGLAPVPVPRTQLRHEGRFFEQPAGIEPAGLDKAVAAQWLGAVRAAAPAGLRPYTRYESVEPLSVLPGQAEYSQLTPQMRLLYARLIAHGLSLWPARAMAVQVRRYNDSWDRFDVPTPAAAFLSTAPWLPVSDAGDRHRVRYCAAKDTWTHGDDAPPFAPLLTPPVRRLLDASPDSAARAAATGIRSWDDPATGPDRIVLLAKLLEAGTVADSVLAPFRRAYDDAWADLVSQGAPLPWPKEGPAAVVVSRAHRLETADLRSPGPKVYVQDADARQNLALLDQCGAALVHLRGSHGTKAAALLGEAFPGRTSTVSGVAVEVTVDGAPFEAHAAAPLLVTADREWLVDLVAAAIELRGSRFRRGGPDAVRRHVARLRQIALVVGDSLTASVGGLSVAPGGGPVRSLAVQHDDSPTVLLRREPQGRSELQRAAPHITELLGQPELADTLRVALIDLDAAGYGDARPPGTEALAQIFDEAPVRVEEVRLSIRRPDDVALDVLIPLVAAFDAAAGRELAEAPDVPRAPAELSAWLAERTGGDHALSGQLLAAALQQDLDSARRLVGLSLPRLNAALAALGPPFQPLSDPEGLAQQFAAHVSRCRPAISDALRRAYWADYEAERPLDRYAQARSQSPTPDPSWASEHLVLEDEQMRERVEAWLAEHGAALSPPDDAAALRPADELRAENRAAALGVLRRAADVAAAWSRQNAPGAALPDPVEAADAAGADGILDFAPVTEDRLGRWLAATGRWPQDMPPTLDLGVLGLPEADVQAAERAQAEACRRRDDERRRVVVDGEAFVAAEENYKQIVDAVRAGITEDFLASAGAAPLEQMQPRNWRGPGPGRPGTTAGRHPRPSDPQSAAIGLAGEVAALDWLKRRHPGTTDDAWVSGYRNQLMGDGRGDDTLGYDLVVDEPRRRIYYEVKATSGDATEFVLTDLEMLRAQTVRKRERYAVLYVTHALDGDMRAIHELPNPLDPANAGFFRSDGQGFRYRFRLAFTA
jgi:hypothetical protein